MKGKNVPPSVGEFAVGERDQLLARVAELEDRYQRDVYGLNNEGDPIGGEPVGGFANENARLKRELAALKQPSAGVDERAAFEAAYAAEFNRAHKDTVTADDVAAMRDGEGYGDRPYLNGQWLGWQARAQLAAPSGVPTHAMILAGEAQWESSGNAAPDVAAIYRAMLAAAPSPAPEHIENRTTGDKYRAELYDEVWQKARGMGYGNVTEALIALERLKPASDVAQVPDYKRKFECLVDHAKRQDQEISRLRYDENVRRYYDDGVVWFWAGDETDNLETLACPVVIYAGDLRALLNGGQV